VSFEGDHYLVEVEKSALFTNYLGLKNSNWLAGRV
jgi:hypothetical protein